MTKKRQLKYKDIKNQQNPNSKLIAFGLMMFW